jgi:hypothetical protein
LDRRYREALTDVQAIALEIARAMTIRRTTMKLLLVGGAVIAAGFAAAAASAAPALYLVGGIDGKMLTNTDANNYFNVKDELGPQGYGSAVGHLGLQFSRYFSVEASVNGGLDRTNDLTYYNFGAPTRHVTTNWKLMTYSVTPGLTWGNQNLVNMLGLRFGQANLTGHIEDDAYGMNGAYDQNAQTMDYGIIFRSSTLVADHFSVGLELGYDWTVFNNIATSNGVGAYQSPQSPDQNISTFGHGGDRTTLDFSGGHVAIVVGLWSGASEPATTSMADTNGGKGGD